MKILVVCQHYWPEPYPLPDVCEELVKRGHQVQVVTDIPNYPLGKIYSGYENGENRDQTHNGVNIHRTFTIGRKNNLFFRFLNYLSFAISSLLYVLHIKEEFDVVFANQTSPVIMSGGALAYGKKHHKKVVLYCMDLWPASLVAGGVRAGSLIYKVFEHISKWIYCGADKILISSKSFRGYLESNFLIPTEKICYHPQYSDVVFESSPLVKKDTVDLMFAGNIGSAQSIPTILQAAKILENHKEIRWHIVGEGSKLNFCKEMAEEIGLDNVIFHGRKEHSEMPQYFAMADAMLLTMFDDPFVSLTLPGKAQAYMAAGKPIIGAANGEIPLVIKEADCGFCANADDPQGLAEAVLEFLQYPDKLLLGCNAKSYYERNFSRNRFMDRLEAVLMDKEIAYS